MDILEEALIGALYLILLAIIWVRTRKPKALVASAPETAKVEDPAPTIQEEKPTKEKKQKKGMVNEEKMFYGET